MQLTPEKIAQIAVDVPLSRQFDYLAPGISLADIGRRALVPFGRRLVVGIIVGIANEPTDPAYKLKRVKEIFYDVPPLPQAILKLAQFCSEYYHYPLGQVLATLLPVRYSLCICRPA